MATILYNFITDDLANPLVEGFGWSGSFTNVNLGESPFYSYPSSVTASYGGVNISFTPHVNNGFKVYPSAENTNHYVTFRSQNIETQYPNTGYSFDIWSETLYNDIVNPSDPSQPGSWQLLTENGPYALNSTKYTLFYNYNAPNAEMYIKGGRINFTVQV